jgi:hypothetical protein
MNATTDNGEYIIWYNGDGYPSYNTGLTVGQEDYWYNGDAVLYLMSDPTDGNFFFFF